MSITTLCIKRPVFTTVLSVLIIVIGIVGLTRIPVRGYPNVQPAVISVSTTLQGTAASVIESQVTTPIENALMGLNGLKSMHSNSREGYSRVVLQYSLGVNIDSAASDVRNRLAHIMQQLPAGTEQPVIQKSDPNSLETVVLSLTDHRLSNMALTDYANRHIVPVLTEVLGVSNVNLFNDRDYAMKILLNPEKMAANRVTVGDLAAVLQSQNINVPSGEIRTPDRYYDVLTQGQMNTANAFRHLIIRDDNGYLLRFSDIARVHVAPASTDSAMRVDGRPAIGLSVYAINTANPIMVATRVKRAMTTLSKTLPEGMQLKVVWDDTNFLQGALHDVYRDLGFAVLLVLVVVSLFLGSWRSALIPIATIPICLIGACALMYWLGYSINVFTLLAFVLAIGLVVDDAIVMLENIYRYVEQGMSAFEAAIRGSREMVFAIIAMTLTLAAVYAPIGFSTGLTGVIFQQFAFTLAITVLLSGFIALTLSPMMCAHCLKKPSEERGWLRCYTVWLGKMFDRTMQYYQRILTWTLAHRWHVIVVLLCVIGVGAWCYHSLPVSLEPTEDSDAFLVSVWPPSNASFAYIDRYNRKVEALLKKTPDVQRVMMMSNRSWGGFAVAMLKPWSKRHKTASQVMAQFVAASKNIAGVKIHAFNVSHFGGGGRYGDAVRMVMTTDQSFPALYQKAEHFLARMRQNPHFRSVTQSLAMNNAHYVLHINHNLAATLQVNIADVSAALRTMLGGAKVTQFNWHDRDYDVILQVPATDRQQLQMISQLYVRNHQGHMIPLSSIARISTAVSPLDLPHLGRLRADTVTITLAKGYSLGQAIRYLQVAGKQHLPADYQIQFIGVAKQLLDSKHTVMLAFLLAILFIYLVLAAQFESFIDPFVILLTVPLSIVGALFALKLTHNEISIYTNIGFVTLIGLIAKHGILITEFTNQLRAKGQALEKALIEAAGLRLRPILMTTAAMVIAAIPLAFASGPGAVGRQHIGWVIVGGLLFGTVFSLIIVPVAYTFLGRYKKIKSIDGALE